MPDSLPDVSPEVLDRVAEAATADGLIQDPLAPPTPPTNESTPNVGTPDGAGQPDGATSQEDSFTPIDPSTLPAELQAIYRSMQGDYTRKMQSEVVPWRGLVDELGISDPAEIRQAAELYTYLQDPANAREFATRLNEAFGLGQPPAGAQTPGTAATPDDPYGLGDDLEGDSPAIKELKAEIQALRQETQAREQTDMAERMQWALVGEIQRQEAFLTEQHPEWQDDDWDALYALAPAYDGDLIQTANVLEGFASARLAGYLNGKQSVAGNPGLQAPPVPRTAEVPRDLSTEAASDPELKAAHAQALDYLRGALSVSE